MLTGFAKWLIIDGIISTAKGFPALVALILAVYIITGMVLSCIVSD